VERVLVCLKCDSERLSAASIFGCMSVNPPAPVPQEAGFPLWLRVLGGIGGAAVAITVALIGAGKVDLPWAGDDGPGVKSVRCEVRMDRGVPVEVTYSIKTSRQIAVGLGVGIYDEEGVDHSKGFGDRAYVPLEEGDTAISRPIKVPTDYKVGTCEVVAEVWAGNKIGESGVDTLGEATCSVPD
jgi:hypothetical protein